MKNLKFYYANSPNESFVQEKHVNHGIWGNGRVRIWENMDKTKIYWSLLAKIEAGGS